uniref:Uncharacterized protein n=1 Tax=Thuretia quercifolia TaxID=189650 RepID=A0A1Z1MKC2_9FLOR|nr:hypothetical protein [Thuretia quercifolia]ARW66527.1 hypothetical protein [Thuretia quercifolia]
MSSFLSKKLYKYYKYYQLKLIILRINYLKLIKQKILNADNI